MVDEGSKGKSELVRSLFTAGILARTYIVMA